MADARPAPLPDLPQVVRHYLDGVSIQELAQQHQRCHRTIYNWLLKACGPEYEETVTDALIARIADADLQLEQATAPIQIARAREIAKFARMDFERRRPKLYGPKQEVVSDNTIRVIIQPPPPVIDVKARRIKELEESKTNAPHEGATGQGSNEEEK